MNHILTELSSIWASGEQFTPKKLKNKNVNNPCLEF